MAATDYDFTATRTEIIEQAFRLIGVLSPGGTLTGNQLAEGVFTLNQIIKSLQSEGVLLWQLSSKEIDVTETVSGYMVGDDPPIVGIDTAFLRKDAE